MYAGPADISCLSNPPKPDVLEATANQFVIIDRTELQLLYIELSNLFRENFSLLTRMDPRYVPDNDHLLGVFNLLCVTFLFTFLTDTGKEPSVRRERYTLESRYRHCQHLKTASRVVIPHANNRAFTLLCGSYQTASLSDIKTADRG